MARGSHIRRLSEDLSQASINYFLKKGKHLDHFSFDLLVVNPCLLAIVSLIFRGMQSKAFFFSLLCSHPLRPFNAILDWRTCSVPLSITKHVTFSFFKWHKSTRYDLG